jgi:hypothetical protein
MRDVQTKAQHFKDVLDAKKEIYKRRLQNPPKGVVLLHGEEADLLKVLFEKEMREYNVTLEQYRNYIAFLTHTTKFLDACIERKSEYEMYALKLKALHAYGPVIEDLHEDADKMNHVLLSHLFIKNLECNMLCR